jgi:hypothetical protein
VRRGDQHLLVALVEQRGGIVHRYQRAQDRSPTAGADARRLSNRSQDVWRQLRFSPG